MKLKYSKFFELKLRLKHLESAKAYMTKLPKTGPAKHPTNTV